MGYGNVSERRRGQPGIGVSVVILALGDPAPSASGPSAAGDSGAGGAARENGPAAAPTAAKVPGTACDGGDATHGELWLPLVRRVREPFRGWWALPGGDVTAEESLERSAYEALGSTTSLHPRYLEQLYTFSGPARSHGGLPMVTVAYWALVGQGEAGDLAGGDNVRWFPERGLEGLRLAFDHREIIDYALLRLRTKIEYPDIVARLVGPTFTLRQLHGVVEAVSGQGIDLANFRRKMLASGRLEDTGEKRREGRQRPAAVYRWAAPAGDPWPYAWQGDRLAALGPGGDGAGARPARDPLGPLVTTR